MHLEEGLLKFGGVCMFVLHWILEVSPMPTHISILALYSYQTRVGHLTCFLPFYVEPVSGTSHP